MDEYYNDSQEHLLDELLLVDLLIHAQVIKFRSMKKAPNELQGLYITETEIDALLEKNPAYNQWSEKIPPVSDEYEKLLELIKILNAAIKRKIEGSLSRGIELKLAEIGRLYQLNSFELEVLTICLAPEFDSKYGKLFAYLQDDVTRKKPSIELVLNLICRTFKEKNFVRRSFTAQAVLFKNNLLEVVPNPNEPEKLLITKDLKVNERIVNYLLEDNSVDDELYLFAGYYTTEHRLEELVIPDDIRCRLQEFITYYRETETTQNFIFALHGAYGSQMLEVAGAVCREIGAPLIVVDLQALYHAQIFFERAVDLLLRESRIACAALYLKNAMFLFEEETDDSYLKYYFIGQFDKHSLLTFTGTREKLPLHGAFVQQKVIDLELPLPDYRQRKELWAEYLHT